MINTCKRPGCLSNEQTICLEGKEHKESKAHHIYLKTLNNEPHLCESLGVWQGGVLWWVQIVMGLIAAVSSKEADSHMGSWQRFCNEFHWQKNQNLNAVSVP